jgi:flagellar secretion chaperone FliS
MWQNAQDTYLEQRVLSAGPLELVNLLYQAATGAVRDARRHLAAGEILARSRAISKACGILTELITSLDHQRGGELSQRLAQLYDYMQRRLLEANRGQIDEPLAEVLSLLATLGNAWEAIKPAAQRAEPKENGWMSTPRVEAGEAGVAAAWSF